MSTLKLYLRHGYDEHPDRYPGHRHDHVLNSNYDHAHRRKIRRLLREYGPPDVIICSPFIRTRDTARMIIEISWS